MVHSCSKGEIQVLVVECAVAVVRGVERHHSESEERQMEYDVGYVGKLLGSGIEEASFVARLIHDEKRRIHHRHRHRHPSSLCH